MTSPPSTRIFWTRRKTKYSKGKEISLGRSCFNHHTAISALNQKSPNLGAFLSVRKLHPASRRTPRPRTKCPRYPPRAWRAFLDQSNRIRLRDEQLAYRKMPTVPTARLARFFRSVKPYPASRRTARLSQDAHGAHYAFGASHLLPHESSSSSSR